MLNVDFLTLRAFFLENIDFFIGARIQKIQQPTRRDFILSMRNHYQSRKLYININPQIYHIAFMSNINEQKRHIIIPQKPPMFCMLLRKYLEGAKIDDAKVIDGERILELYFETYDELNDKRQLCLCIELMGKHSNVILYDSNSEIIIGCAHNVGSEKSRHRELQGGLKYIYPPKKSNVKGDELYLSNELKEQFCDLSNNQIEQYLSSEIFRPAVKGDKYTLFKELIADSIPENSVNEMLDNYYSKVQEDFYFKTEQSRLKEIVFSKLKKTLRSISKIESLLTKRDDTSKYKLYGELLTANLYVKADYQSCVELYDYTTESNINIELDSTKSMNENAQKYFKLYAKSKNIHEKSQERLLRLNIEKNYLETILYSINTSKTIDDLEDIKTELGIIDNVKLKNKNIKKSPIEKIIINNFDVFIGKNNKQNDYIVSKLAKDNDYWFHTKLYAGSHVLLKTNECEPDENTIFECCKLAKQYSSSTISTKVGVIYTKAKYLRKPPASPLGYVTYKNEREVLV